MKCKPGDTVFYTYRVIRNGVNVRFRGKVIAELDGGFSYIVTMNVPGFGCSVRYLKQDRQDIAIKMGATLDTRIALPLSSEIVEIVPSAVRDCNTCPLDSQCNHPPRCRMR